MIRRLLGTLPVRIALVGGVGAVVLVVGALADSWRLAAVGLAVGILACLALVLLVVRGVQRAQRAVGDAAALGGRGDAGVSEELALARTLDVVLERGDLVGRIDEVVRRRDAAERAELAAMVRLVTRHDTSPPVPVPSAVPSRQAYAAVRAVEEAAPRRVLAVGLGVAALWTVHALRETGGRLDLVCDESDADPLRAAVRARGAEDVVAVLPVPRAVPDVPYAVHPWFVLPEGPSRADVVLVVAPTAHDARTTLPALPLLLGRLEAEGRLVVVEDADHPVLVPAWTAAASVVADPAADSSAGTVVLRPAPAAPPEPGGMPQAETAGDLPR